MHKCIQIHILYYNIIIVNYNYHYIYISVHHIGTDFKIFNFAKGLLKITIFYYISKSNIFLNETSDKMSSTKRKEDLMFFL